MKRIVMLILLFPILLNTHARNKTYAVIVGISDYKYPNMCHSLGGHTVKSARMAAKFFYEKDPSHTYTHMLLDGNATKEHIVRVMKNYFTKALWMIL